MKISELVAHLSRFQADHGDIEVKISYEVDIDPYPIASWETDIVQLMLNPKGFLELCDYRD